VLGELVGFVLHSKRLESQSREMPVFLQQSGVLFIQVGAYPSLVHLILPSHITCAFSQVMFILLIGLVLEGVGLIAIGSGLAVGLSAIAAGIAEKEIGAAAIGAIAEKEEMFGKGLIFTVIPETLVIFGLVVAILILNLAKGG